MRPATTSLKLATGLLFLIANSGFAQNAMDGVRNVATTNISRGKRAWQVASVLLGARKPQQYPDSSSGAWQEVGPSYPASASPFGYAAPMQMVAYAMPPTPLSFRWIRSAGGEVGMAVPADWQIAPPAGQNFGAFSGRGESFSCGLLDVFADLGSMRNAQQAFAVMGRPRQELAFMQRLVSPPLTADQIVSRLFAQISGGAIQNLRVLGARQLPDGSAIVAYQYVLLPGRDALYRTLLPPALQRYSQVPMQGEAHIRLVPGMRAGAVRTWSFLYAIVSAPQPVYASYARVYAAMFKSIQTNSGAVQQGMAEQQGLATSIGTKMKRDNQKMQEWSRKSMDEQQKQLEHNRDFNYKSGDIWTDMAGAQQRYIDPNDPSWASRTSADNIPIGAQYIPYRCPNEDTTNSKIFWGDGTARPYVDCIRLQEY
jgi:hypothetical protein